MEQFRKLIQNKNGFFIANSYDSLIDVVILSYWMEKTDGDNQYIAAPGSPMIMME
jgi:hypothetical protein